MTSDDDNETSKIELKDPDLESKKDISVHHTGICLMQIDRSTSGLNFKNCVLLDSESKVHTFYYINLLQTIWAQEEVMTLVDNVPQIRWLITKTLIPRIPSGTTLNLLLIFCP